MFSGVASPRCARGFWAIVDLTIRITRMGERDCAHIAYTHSSIVGHA